MKNLTGGGIDSHLAGCTVFRILFHPLMRFYLFTINIFEWINLRPPLLSF
jgi:hypothetical protein